MYLGWGMDKSYSGGREQLTCTFVTCDSIKKRLRVLHDIQGKPWRTIARTAEFHPIPAGTLHDIYSGKKIPKRWHEQLRYPKPRPPRIAIRLDNPESAARSIEKHMEPEIVGQLIGLLQEGK